MDQITYQDFKKTKFYQALSPYGKLLAGLFFLDTRNRGLTYSQLEKKLQGGLTKEQISMALDMGSDLQEITERDSQRNGLYVRTYRLANHEHIMTLDGFVTMLSSANAMQKTSR